jgi:hypothetical protein
MVQIFRYVTVCVLVSGWYDFWFLVASQLLHLQGSSGQCLLLDHMTRKMKTIKSLTMSGSTDSVTVTQCHIPDDMNRQQLCCENLTSCFSGLFVLAFVWEE